ncbi:MAG: hypothetical protein AB7P40_01365 [Chloroflexota bacterium]
MKIVFFMTHPGFTRNYESTLALLAERGHQIHLAFDGPPQVGKPGAVDALEAMYPSISHGPAPDRDDVWSPLAGAIRALRNALRYLHPRYRRATRLRERAIVWPLGPVLNAIAASPVSGQRGIRLLDRLLQAVERIVPSSPAIERYLLEELPDIVLLTPVVDFNTAQTDQLKSARALGIPTGVCVASWDNLTNKGLIQMVPDLVTVWNEHQRREAVELHGIPKGRVVATGAQIFDEWFVRRPTATRAEFCARLGLPEHRPIVLYTCSSQWIAPHEVPFVRRWLKAVRSGPEPLASASILVRPHPQNAAQWQGVDFPTLGPVAISPRDPSASVSAASKADFYDALYHSTAVVGINTSALIEAGIVGRPVLSVLDDEHRNAQDGTLHFRYLVEESGGLLQVADGLPAHVEQLAAALTDQTAAERAQAFVSSFIRPHGIRRPATPILADALERLQALRPVPERSPGWALTARPVFFGAACLARLAWGLLKRRQRRPVDVSFGPMPGAATSEPAASRSAFP